MDPRRIGMIVSVLASALTLSPAVSAAVPGEAPFSRLDDQVNPRVFGPYAADSAQKRLLDGARDSSLTGWQREAMRRLAGEWSAAVPAAGSSPLPSGTGSGADGTWSQILPSEPLARDSPAGIYDPVRDRFIYFGGYDASVYSNETWCLRLEPMPSWTRLSPSGPLPAGRSWHTAVYDPAGDRMLIFGGWDGTTMFDDVWALSLDGSTAWTQVQAQGAPPAARIGHTSVFDSRTRRMLVFGGTNLEEEFNDLWALSLDGPPAWSMLQGLGAVPTPRNAHSAIVDAARDRLVSFGGWGSGITFGDAWGFDLTTQHWNPLPIVGPAPTALWLHAAVHDTRRNEMIVFGGSTPAGQSAEVYSFALGESLTASRLIPVPGFGAEPRVGHGAVYDSVGDAMFVYGGLTGAAFNGGVMTLGIETHRWTHLAIPGPAPGGRAYHSTAFDSRRRRMIVFGGWDGTDLHNDAWELETEGRYWIPLTSFGQYAPSPRDGAAAVYDPDGDQLIVFGGNDGPRRLNDVWSLSIESGQWTQLGATGDVPFERFFAAAAYDRSRERLLVFGGERNGVPYFNDVSALSLRELSWERLEPMPPRPERRAYHASALDTDHEAMVVFGGWGRPNGPLDDTFRNDTWRYRLDWSGWEEIRAANPPSVLDGVSAIYDPMDKQVVVFGGNTGVGRSNDAWALRFEGEPAWRRLEAGDPRPTPRFLQSAVYDSRRKGMVVFAGRDWDFFGDVWSLSLGPSPSWQLLKPTYPWPREDFYCTSIVDLRRNRMLLFGGYTQGLKTIWSMDLTDPTQWTPITTTRVMPDVRFAYSAVYDGVEDRVIVFGGLRGHTASNETWALSLADPPTWTELLPEGEPPSPRDQAAMVLDPERRRLVLFGGDYDWVFYYGGTWELTLEDGLRWNPLAPEGTAPSERSGGAFAFDQPADRLVMIGGETDHQPPGFVWALGFGPLEWTELHPSGQGPQWFSRGASILDPVGRRMILFGQYLTGVDEPTTWSLALKDPPEWRLLDVAGGPPRGAFKPAAVHDPARSRMLLFGGFDGKAYNELWQLTWDRPTPTILSLVSARAEAGRVELIWQASGAAGGVVLRSRNGADWSIVGAVSADGAGMLRFVDDGIAEGGHIGYRIDVRSQEGEPVSSETWLDVPVLWRLAVRGFQPNPAVGTPRVAFTVPARGQVTVEVLDVAGRTVLSQEFTIDEPGPQSATPAWSARVPAGVYWIKLRQGTDHVVKKGVVLR